MQQPKEIMFSLKHSEFDFDDVLQMVGTRLVSALSNIVVFPVNKKHFQAIWRLDKQPIS